MHFHRSYNICPSKTPTIIKFMLILILGLSVFSAIITPSLKLNYFGYYLGLSLDGIKHYYFWQLITYNFLQPSYGISIGFLAHLLFNCYIIWFIGCSVIEKTSSLQFALLYLFSTLFSGLVMLLVMYMGYPHLVFASTSIGLYTTLFAWMMVNPKDMRIFLFLAFPIKVMYIVCGLIGISILISLSNLQFVNFFGYLACVIFTYLFSVIFWYRHSPFDFLDKFERNLIYFSRGFFNNIKRRK